MKKTILVCLLAYGWIALLAQPVSPDINLSKEDYLRKSRNQKTAAWILLGGGAGMATAGAIWFMDSWSLWGDADPEESYSAALFYAGILSMAGSIPLFIASARNKRKAGALSLEWDVQRVDLTAGRHLPVKRIPSVSLKWRW